MGPKWKSAFLFLAVGVYLSSSLGAQTPGDPIGVVQLEKTAGVHPTKALDAELQEVITQDDPPEGIYLPLKRKNNHAQPQPQVGQIYKEVLKHPFGQLGGKSPDTPFVVSMVEPKAFAGVQSYTAKKLMKPFSFADLAPGSRLPILRVTVSPRVPIYGVNGGNHVLNVVLTDKEQTLIIQPVLMKSFGVDKTASYAVPVGGDMVAFDHQTTTYGGYNAVFTMADLEKVRSKSPDRSFYITIIGSGDVKQTYKVDPSYFEQLGD